MHVLLVDDDEDILKMVGTMLRMKGHTVDVVASAFGVTNRVAGRSARRPDLVVLDVMMPGLSGDTVLRLLAQDPVACLVPVLVFAAVDDGMLQGLEREHPRCRVVQKGDGVRSLMARVAETATALAAGEAGRS